MRRFKKDVMSQLPRKRRQIVRLPPPSQEDWRSLGGKTGGLIPSSIHFDGKEGCERWCHLRMDDCVTPRLAELTDFLLEHNFVHAIHLTPHWGSYRPQAALPLSEHISTAVYEHSHNLL